MTAPTSLPEVIGRLDVAGHAIKNALLDAEECIKWLEDNPPEGKRVEIAQAARDVAFGHTALDRGGYKLEDACGVPDGTFGAGGGNKPPPGGGG